GGGPGTEEEGPVGGVGGRQAVAALHQGGVEGGDVEQGAEAQLFLYQPNQDAALRPEQVRVQKQLTRIVTGLAVDVHGAGVVGRVAVLRPEGVGEPGVRVRQGDHFAGPRLTEVQFGSFLAGANATDTGQFLQDLNNSGHVGGVGDVDVRQLMVADGERPAGDRAQDLPDRTAAHRQ